jgi:hypothetical protein
MNFQTLRYIHIFRASFVTGLILIFTLSAAAEVLQPVVREPVAPRVNQNNLRVLSKEQTVKPWNPGDPVRVVEDLKESHEVDMSAEKMKPKVRPPVAPETMKKELKDLPKVEPMKPGDSVRIVEDLKEDKPLGDDDRSPDSGKDHKN